MIKFFQDAWRGDASPVKLFIYLHLIPFLFVLSEFYNTRSGNRFPFIDSKLFWIGFFLSLNYFYYFFIKKCCKNLLSFYLFLTASIPLSLFAIYSLFSQKIQIIASTNIYEYISIISVCCSIFYFINLTKKEINFDEDKVKKYNWLIYLLSFFIIFLITAY